jgi:hypothetical protein
MGFFYPVSSFSIGPKLAKNGRQIGYLATLEFTLFSLKKKNSRNLRLHHAVPLRILSPMKTCSTFRACPAPMRLAEARRAHQPVCCH